MNEIEGASILAQLAGNAICKGPDASSRNERQTKEFRRHIREAEVLIAKLGELRYEPAIPLLLKLYQEFDVQFFLFPRTPGRALLRIGTDEVHGILQSSISADDLWRREVAIDSYFLSNPSDAFDRLSPFFTESQSNIASSILAYFNPILSRIRVHRSTPRALLLDDPRWIELALNLRSSGLSSPARSLLSNLTAQEFKRALDRFKKPTVNEGMETLAKLKIHLVSTVASEKEFKGSIDQAGALVERLGELRYEPAIPHLARLCQELAAVPHPLPRHHHAPTRIFTRLRSNLNAGGALYVIGTPEAHRILQSYLLEKDWQLRAEAIRSFLFSDPDRAFDKLVQFFSADFLSSNSEIGGSILEFFHPLMLKLHRESLSPRQYLLNDSRWIDLAYRLKFEGKMEDSARQLLYNLSPTDRREALDRYRESHPPFSITQPEKRNFLERYQKGEYTEVWRELIELGPIITPSLREEAIAVGLITMERVRFNVATINKRLTDTGYPFEAGPELEYRKIPWSPPPENVEALLKKMESLIGGELPISLRAFWTAVGSLSWTSCYKTEEEHSLIPSYYRLIKFDFGYQDPLFIEPPDRCLAQVEEQVEERAAFNRELGSVLLSISPDWHHKAQVCGGENHRILAASGSMDEIVEWEGHDLHLVNYLRLSFQWGGFPRLKYASLNTLQQAYLDELRSGLLNF